MGRRLEATKRPTIELELAPGCMAEVAFVTRKESSDILTRAIRRRWDAEANDGRGGIVPEVDQMLVLRERLRIGAPSVSGLTDEVLLSLAELPDGASLDLAEPDPWDHSHVVFRETIQVDDPTPREPHRKRSVEREFTLPMYLHVYGARDGFGARFEQAQQEFAKLLAEAEKKRSKMPEN